MFLENKLSFKKLLPFIIGYGIMLILIVVGYFVDYNLTASLSNLQNGEYFSGNVFGRIFEVVGENPLYFVGAIGIGLGFGGLKYIKKSWLSKLFLIVGIIMMAGLYIYMTLRTFKNVCQMNYKYDWYKSHKILILGIGTLVSCLLCPITIYLTSRVKDENKLQFSFVGLIIIIGAVLSQAFTQGIKPFIGRLRYRAIYVLKENGLAEYAKYTSFITLNGKGTLTPEMEALGLTKDIFKSFPSGHTTAGSVIMGLCFLPLAFRAENQKKYCIIFSVVSILYIIVLAISRMVMGAHFLTDVTCGFGITFTSYVVAYFLVRLIVKKHPSLIPNK